MPPRHRFLEPIHNVKEGKQPTSAPKRQPHVFIPGNGASLPARRQSRQKPRLVARYAALAVLAAGAI
jgi:hypothetical protein